MIFYCDLSNELVYIASVDSTSNDAYVIIGHSERWLNIGDLASINMEFVGVVMKFDADPFFKEVQQKTEEYASQFKHDKVLEVTAYNAYWAGFSFWKAELLTYQQILKNVRKNSDKKVEVPVMARETIEDLI